VPSDNDDRRKEARSSHYASVQFHLDSCPDNDMIPGVTRDMGDSGICMYTMYSLTEGQVITFRGNGTKPNQRAVVIWVKKYGGFYKVGLEFESAPSAMPLQHHRDTSHH
jgi:hypothetical protein